MESVKLFFTSNKNNSKSRFKKRSLAISLVDKGFKRVVPEYDSIGAYYPGHATTAFIPHDRGRQQTLAWLDTGTSESIVSLLKERDRAARQVQSSRTKGTKETQMILNEPSCKTVEMLHNVQRRAEMTIRYGGPGAAAYNFSRSLGWNRASTYRLPSLQLRDFGDIMRECEATSAGNTPATPFSPINWIVLQDPTKSPRPRWNFSFWEHEDELDEQPDCILSPISEPGGWRDSEQVDITDSRPRFTQEISQGDAIGDYDPYSMEVEPMTPAESEATAIKLTPVFNGQIRQVRI
ncbi:hypothetical protein F4825DRAFT_451068 [Nemania diffusa]|nr:hypothetical protein F4825DRAFT_451068 [Nemania diffusa]